MPGLNFTNFLSIFIAGIKKVDPQVKDAEDVVFILLDFPQKNIYKRL
jgi:hypothetical protein